MYYPQPSFVKTHKVELNLDKKWSEKPALDLKYYSSTFYKR